LLSLLQLTEYVTSNLQQYDVQVANHESMYSFEKTLRNADHTLRYSIQTTQSGGWVVREEKDSKVIRQTHYQDWHRVERARRVFFIKYDSLRAEGWQEA
jgi:type III secretory pathway component EscV